MSEASDSVRKEIDRLVIVRDGLQETFNEVEGMLTQEGRDAFNMVIHELSLEIIQLGDDANGIEGRG